jgi:hypothetical protein
MVHKNCNCDFHVHKKHSSVAKIQHVWKIQVHVGKLITKIKCSHKYAKEKSFLSFYKATAACRNPVLMRICKRCWLTSAIDICQEPVPKHRAVKAYGVHTFITSAVDEGKR